MKRYTGYQANILLLIALGCFLIAAGAAAQVLPKRPGDIKVPPLQFKQPQLDKISLACGLSGFLMEDHEIPVVNIQMRLPCAFESKEKSGLNELAGWALRSGGSLTIPADSLNAELEFRSASIETRANSDWVAININCLTKDLSRCLELVSDLILHPAFPESKIALKKKTMAENVRRENDEPRSLGEREFRKVLFGDHPATWQPTLESIQGLTRQDVERFWKTYGVPTGGLIGISGDVRKDEITKKLNDVFKSWSGGPAEISAFPQMREGISSSVNQVRKDINQAYIMIGHPGITEQNPDRPIVTLMNYVLGGGSFKSWITEKIRVEQGLAYSAGSRYGAAPRGVGVFAAYTQTKAEAMSRSVNTILALIKKMQEEGPSEEELGRARQSLLNRYVFSYESPASIVDRALYLKFFGLPLDQTELDLKAYETATVQDMKRAARKYLHPDELAIVVVGDPAKFDKSLDTWGNVNEIKLKEN
ncbi:MAG: pitrilysin family protein [Candidatus Eisenbacteria bacterium]|nr:pitrilysin family protein [Candidatus Eisenbacteria bacterium]